MCLEVFAKISSPSLAGSGKLGATEFMNPVPPDSSRSSTNLIFSRVDHPFLNSFLLF
jgi:hypothetical protein